MRELEVHKLGLIPYARGLEIQNEIVPRRRAGELPDQLLLLEHPHVITLGSSSNADHILIGEEERRLLGIEIFESGRGGDVTYHGPGQLVGYPILDLKPDRCDLHRYIRDLEEVIIRTIAEFGVVGGRKRGMTGVWVDDKKVAAIGVRVASRWITSHGFALNVETDLDYFDAIVPCGISGHGVVSLAQLTATTLTTAEVADRLAIHFAALFGRRIV